MRGAHWEAARGGVEQATRMFAPNATVFLRLMPGLLGCSYPAMVEPYDGRRPLAEPSTQGFTPIAKALEDLDQTFGDPNEQQAVILVTDGDETCATADDVLAQVVRLRALGIKTFAVAIGAQANGELLSAVARAGGTETASPGYYRASSRREVFAALSDIYTRLDGCGCDPMLAPSESACFGDAFYACDASHTAWQLAGPAPTGWCDCALGTSVCGAPTYGCTRDGWEAYPGHNCWPEYEPNAFPQANAVGTLPSLIFGELESNGEYVTDSFDPPTTGGNELLTVTLTIDKEVSVTEFDPNLGQRYRGEHGPGTSVFQIRARSAFELAGSERAVYYFTVTGPE